MGTVNLSLNPTLNPTVILRVIPRVIPPTMAQFFAKYAVFKKLGIATLPAVFDSFPTLFGIPNHAPRVRNPFHSFGKDVVLFQLPVPFRYILGRPTGEPRQLLRRQSSTVHRDQPDRLMLG